MGLDFIAKENVERFLGQLQNSQLAENTQKTLQKLLVEEEDKLARNREILELAERWAHEGKQRIKTLKQSIEKLGAGELPRQCGLAAMEEIQRIIESFHRQLRDELLPYCVMLESTMVSVCRSFDEAETRAKYFANANPKLVVTIIDRSNGDSHVVGPQHNAR